MKTKNAKKPRTLSFEKTTLKNLTAVRTGIKAGLRLAACNGSCTANSRE